MLLPKLKTREISNTYKVCCFLTNTCTFPHFHRTIKFKSIQESLYVYKSKNISEHATFILIKALNNETNMQ